MNGVSVAQLLWVVWVWGMAFVGPTKVLVDEWACLQRVCLLPDGVNNSPDRDAFALNFALCCVIFASLVTA